MSAPDLLRAEQRLQPQRGARVARNRRILARELERREGPAVGLIEAQPDDLADVDAGDPHVGPGRELVGLGERDLDPDTLRWSKYGRQFAVVDAKGNVAAYTGRNCLKAGDGNRTHTNLLGRQVLYH